jgi:hypothetical protein
LTRAFLALALCAGAVFWCACGLKGPPIPPDATKAGEPAARSGSGPLQFGPRAPKTDEEEDKKILELYGRKPPEGAGPSLPGDALGIDAVMAEPDNGVSADDPTSPFDPSVAATPAPTPPPEGEPEATTAPSDDTDSTDETE